MESSEKRSDGGNEAIRDFGKRTGLGHEVFLSSYEDAYRERKIASSCDNELSGEITDGLI